MYKGVEGPRTRLIVLAIITGSHFRRGRRFTIFEPDETNFAENTEKEGSLWKCLLYSTDHILRSHLNAKGFC